MVLGAQAPGRVGRRPPFSSTEARYSRASVRERQRRSLPRSIRRHSPRLLLAWSSRMAISCCASGRKHDVPALVAGCNDAEISHWIPLIPHPYTEEDAREFVSGDVAPADYRLAITVAGAVVGGIGMGLNSNEYRGDDRLLGRARAHGARDLHARGTPARALRARGARAAADRPDHGSGQRGLAARRREGRVPA